MIEIDDTNLNILIDLYQHEILSTELNAPPYRMAKPVGSFSENDYSPLVTNRLVSRLELDLRSQPNTDYINKLRDIYPNHIVPLFRLTSTGKDLIALYLGSNDLAKQ